MDTMAAIRTTFFQECDEQLVELEAGLLELRAGSGDAETVNAVFRAVHSIKGGAGAFDLDALVRFAHGFENTLDALRTQKISADPALIEAMLRAADHLTDVVRAGRDGMPADPARSEELLGALAEFLPDATRKSTPTAAAPPESDDEEFVFQPLKVDLADFADLAGETACDQWVVTFHPRPELYTKGNETTILFRELERLGGLSVACNSHDLPDFDALDPAGSYLSWTVEVAGCPDADSIREIFEFAAWDSEFIVERLTSEPLSLAADPAPDEVAAINDLCEPANVGHSAHADSDPEPAPLAPSQPPPASEPSTKAIVATADHPSKTASATIRVDLDRVDRLIDLVGELVINQAMLTERVGELGLPRRSAVSNGLEELEQLTRAIQDSVMAIRAQPVRSVFQRLPRLVREVAAQTGKSVRLVTEGESTEVDKTVIEHLGDPLTHMIRNAIDHGLEDPATRTAASKPAEGVLRVSALHRSGRIVIDVSDDGQGINRTRVYEIARDKGLIAPDAKLSDEEIDNLIFQPGFSTADTISDISGRGVGMDVVRRSVQALGGRISIASTPGKGSTFTLSLPLTLAVLDGIVVTVADQTLVVPLSAVVEILMPKDVHIHDLGEGSKVVGLRNSFLSVVDVGSKLGIRPDAASPQDSVVLIVESESGTEYALVVDAIQGQRQVVIKSLESNYGAVPGIAAATILGDGRVALILDVDRLTAESGNQGLGFSQISHIGAHVMASTAEQQTASELVTFLIGRQEFCVDIMSVREIRGWTPATPLPHAPTYVQGVINLRGAVLSIVDLADRLGLPTREPTARHVIVVVQIGDQLAGLLVDAVTGILSIGNDTVLPTPDAAPDTTRQFIKGVLAIDNRMISLIGLEHVLPSIRQAA